MFLLSTAQGQRHFAMRVGLSITERTSGLDQKLAEEEHARQGLLRFDITSFNALLPVLSSFLWYLI